MRKSSDALSKDIRQYAVVMHITKAQKALNTETLFSVGDVRTSVVFIKWRPYLQSAVFSTLSHTDVSRMEIRFRIDEEFRHLSGPRLPRRHRFKITVLTASLTIVLTHDFNETWKIRFCKIEIAIKN